MMLYGNAYKQRRARREELARKRADGTMQTRPQQRGTCQVCGRDVAVETDTHMTRAPRTSKHGYTVEPGWGFFGTCMGSDQEPYETSRAILVRYVHQACENVMDMQERADWLREGKVEVVGEIVTDYNKPKNRRQSVVNRTQADFPRELPYTGGRTQTWLQFCGERANEIERDIKSLTRHIEEQQVRIEQWAYAPEKIRTVQVEIG
jgi:hypothetical protein